MAFPIPSHLPRRPNPQDVSSEILMKIDEATNQTLTASLATSWLAELEATIQATERHVYDRIHLDLPQFEQQLESSKSVQTRLQSLASNVDGLNQTLSQPETGLIPTLLRSLTAHATLTQESADATVRHETLSHLLRCRKEFGSILSLVEKGQLPQAIQSCAVFDQLLQDAPAHLQQTNVMLDLKRKFQAARSRAEEQLSEAYTRSVVMSPKSLTILPSVAVRQSETILSLPEILASLSETSLSSHLTTLRRDLMNYYVDHVLQQPTSLTISSEIPENRLTLFPSPPNSENLNTRLDNVAATLKFLSTHFMASLPPSESLTFSRSLCKPIVTSVLSNLLVPSLPSSFDLLSQFIALGKHAVAFEDEYVIRLLGDEKSDRPIKAWVDGMGGTYERQRRVKILDASRVIILSPEVTGDRFVVEVDIRQDNQPEVVPVQVEDDTDASWGLNGSSNSSEAVDDGWGFDDDADPESAPAPASSSLPATEPDPPAEEVAEDGWGFDDEDEADPSPEPEPEEPPEPEANGHDEPDDDAWGWNDDAPADSAQDTAWDAWDEPPTKSSPAVNKASISPASTSSPKMATRLEKLANKGKKHLNGSSPLASPSLVAPRQPAPAPVPSSPPPTTSSPPKKGPPTLSPVVVPKESYLVSGRIRQIINLVEDVLAEGQKFAASKIFLPIETGLPAGTVLLQSAASILDLYRSLYPVKFKDRLKTAVGPMQFSNDCLFLSGEIARIQAATAAKKLAPVEDRLVECRTRLKIMSESWYEDTVEHYRQTSNDIISQGAQGFTSTADQDRYDECETAVSRVVQEIKRLAQQWKGILNKSKYYTAIGMVTEAALSRVLEDILALPDIPEVESHRLSELCRMLHALEALFVEDTHQGSFVVAYVPSWLKFSYLSELMEASMVDISYLFDSGALVDFETDELVRLVRALFADTPLRTNTINKLTAGRQ
ncbi:Dsl1-C domain-containing protein [Mycena sanguinolenta]|uniref:Dsl1-C domain-containing protein n=1 Tax=Mycena sanguinolenta TaxID=230812 RepID=A0A8H6Z403_9AGAR|nr:Dsl1-C domain-containing protein [Mycena sanguinolenta]